ncbi:MAG: transposase, partial [Anabaena sp. MDT14b]
NLQRFLGIGKLCVKLLWFPLIKYWIRQSLTPKQLNREQRAYLISLFIGRENIVTLD